MLWKSYLYNIIIIIIYTNMGRFRNMSVAQTEVSEQSHCYTLLLSPYISDNLLQLLNISSPLSHVTCNV